MRNHWKWTDVKFNLKSWKRLKKNCKWWVDKTETSIWFWRKRSVNGNSEWKQWIETVKQQFLVGWLEFRLLIDLLVTSGATGLVQPVILSPPHLCPDSFSSPRLYKLSLVPVYFSPSLALIQLPSVSSSSVFLIVILPICPVHSVSDDSWSTCCSPPPSSSAFLLSPPIEISSPAASILCNLLSAVVGQIGDLKISSVHPSVHLVSRTYWKEKKISKMAAATYVYM